MSLEHFCLDRRLKKRAIWRYATCRWRTYMDVSEPVLLILLSLAEQPRHGYAILQDTEQMSEGRVRLSTGTLYGALRRLLEEDWIERFKEQDSSRGGQGDVTHARTLPRAPAPLSRGVPLRIWRRDDRRPP